MARPLSPEKRNALLASATAAVAEQGMLATTSSIAKGAGVAEGTLFTYFENKDALLQALYLHLKHSLAQSLMPGYPAAGSYRQRLQHTFEGYVRWGLAHSQGRLALARLGASGLLSESTQQEGAEPFLPIFLMMESGVAQQVFTQAPVAFLSSVIEDIAKTTIEFMERQPEQAEHYPRLGFEMVWRAVSQ